MTPQCSTNTHPCVLEDQQEAKVWYHNHMGFRLSDKVHTYYTHNISAYTQYNTPCSVHQYILTLHTLPLLAMVHIVKNRYEQVAEKLYLTHMHDKALLVLDQQSGQLIKYYFI